MRVVTDEKVLRLPCEPVKSVKEGGEVSRLLQATLRSVNKKGLRTFYKSGGQGEMVYGIGLAAPQIGIHKRVCVILLGNAPLVLMNPEIVERSGVTIGFEESCLSLPGVKLTIQRHTWVKVKALNHVGPLVFGPTTPEEWSQGAILKSVVAQHEIDHLNGVLIKDHKE